MTPDEIAQIYGYKNNDSKVACTEIMNKKNIMVTPNRDHFIKGWQECEKWRDANENR